MGIPCDCGLPAEKITAITKAIEDWPKDTDQDLLQIAQAAGPDIRIRDVLKVSDHIAAGHDLPTGDPEL